jgi:hypothetical protein
MCLVKYWLGPAAPGMQPVHITCAGASAAATTITYGDNHQVKSAGKDSVQSFRAKRASAARLGHAGLACWLLMAAAVAGMKLHRACPLLSR